MTLIEKVKKLISMAKFHNETQKFFDNFTGRQIYTFYQNTYIKEIVDFDFSKVTKLNNLCQGCTALERVIINNEIATSWTNAFRSCSNLKSVKTLNWSNIGSGNGSSAFLGCTSLEELLCEPNTISTTINVEDCPLNKESVESIAVGLIDNNGSGIGRTVYLNESIDTSDEEIAGYIAIMLDKGWSVSIGGVEVTE